MIRFSSAAAGMLALTIMFGTSAQAVTINSIYMNGQELEMGLHAELVNGSTMVPMRSLFEMLGYEVSWSNQNESIHAYRADNDIKLQIGETRALLNNSSYVGLPHAPYLHDNIAMVPLRLVSESAGSIVGWEGLTQSVTIDSMKAERVKVSKILDEQTLLIVGNDKNEKAITFLGVNVSSKMKDQALSDLKALKDKTIFISTSSASDPYGRIMGNVFLEDGTFYNAKIVSEGLGSVKTENNINPWEPFLSFLEGKAKESGFGEWAYGSSTSNEVSLSAIQQKASNLGVVLGNVQIEQYLTEELFLRLLLEVLFPELRYVFIAKTVSDILQNEDVQKIAAIALEKGILTVDDLKDGKLRQNQVINSEKAARWLEKALKFHEDTSGRTLADFGVFENSSAAGNGLTWDAALAAVEKTKNVYPHLMKYYESVKNAMNNATDLEKYGEAKENHMLMKQGKDIQNILAGKNLETTIYQLSDSVLDFSATVFEAMKNGISHLGTSTEYKRIKSGLKTNIKEAQEALERALKANDN